MTARLNINIDHVATVRQARRAPEPSVIAATMACEQAGADGITVHLRGDRRHIQDLDVRLLRESVTTYLNLEMAATEEMLDVAREARPDAVTLVAERPDEITTEGGLDVKANKAAVSNAVDAIRESGMLASLFIDPDPAQIEVAHEIGAQQVELCTAAYAEAMLGARGIHGEGAVHAHQEWCTPISLRSNAREPNATSHSFFRMGSHSFGVSVIGVERSASEKSATSPRAASNPRRTARPFPRFDL